MTPREALRTYAEALPAGTVVPVLREVILELLGGARDHTAATAPPSDLTVGDVARQFNRRPATVRGWCEEGVFPGAYHFRGREWRIPPAALETFLAEERQRTPGQPQLRRPRRALDRLLRSERR
jgi:Helix-turn-helix domain